ncbi:hypothetical protein RMN56_28695 [Micromonospora halotolerans]|uniref:DUF4386 family protein n=1 Tax=Micromonospora halotolerans TaxID=709879 RepID=A0ABY9ZVL8_9ACTN|nr:hypothetical protein [Micromonospora halotolerans]WNM39067.1 hypothetical protein RMN56_28695 [Micromonospora halotolerans]
MPIDGTRRQRRLSHLQQEIIMTDPSSRPARPLAAALCAAPLLFLVSELIVPRDNTENPAAELALFAEHSAAFRAADLSYFAAMVLLAAAVPAVVRLVRGRGRIFVRVAGTMTFLGTMGLAAHAVLLLSTLDLALDPRHAEMAAADGVISNGTGAMVILFLRLFGFDLGLTLLTIAAWRARLVPVWAAPLGFLCLVGDFSPGNWNGILSAVAATAVFGILAMGVLRAGRTTPAESAAPAPIPATT